MAKKSMLERELKRKKLVKKYSEKRSIILNELKKAVSLDEIFLLNEKIQKLPRNSSNFVFVIVVGKQEDRVGIFVILDYVEMLFVNYHMNVFYLE